MGENPSKNRIRAVVAFCFCLFVLAMAVVNVKLAVKPALSFLTGELTFKEMTQEIAGNYVSEKLWRRSDFINFNGLLAKTSGRHAYNKTMLMDNGMLNYGTDTFSEEPDEILVTYLTESVGQFSEYLGTRDIPFYFVLAPVKEDVEGELIPDAFHNYQNETGDQLLTRLSEQGIDTLDLREYLTQNAEQSEKFFYRTDHHWNGDGALLGFSVLMDYLRNQYDPSLDISYADPECWERFTLEDSFLGTHGKRVGKYYAGTDDLIWYEPKFETEMSLSVPAYSYFYKGPFSEVDIREEYREKQDYFEVTPYVIYIGGDYPSVQHRNVNAPNQKKVLFIKDSFGLPVQAFLSTEFYAVDVIDPRYYTETGIASYCEWEQPDLVIMMMSPSAVSNWYYNRVAISEEERSLLENRTESILLNDLTINMDGDNRKENAVKLMFIPEPGKTYRITFENVTANAEMPDAISAVLYNETIEDYIQQRIFDTDFNGIFEPWQWTFTIPNEGDPAEFSIYLCSGLFETENNPAVTISGISVTGLS